MLFQHGAIAFISMSPWCFVCFTVRVNVLLVSLSYFFCCPSLGCCVLINLWLIFTIVRVLLNGFPKYSTDRFFFLLLSNLILHLCRCVGRCCLLCSFLVVQTHKSIVLGDSFETRTHLGGSAQCFFFFLWVRFLKRVGSPDPLYLSVQGFRCKITDRESFESIILPFTVGFAAHDRALLVFFEGDPQRSSSTLFDIYI